MLEGHPHLGAVVGAAAQLERLGERGDERQAEAEAGAVGAREHPAALVAHGDHEAPVAHAGGDLHRAVALRVGVDDDVGARLGHGELDVGQDLVLDVQRVAEAAERVADDGDVLCARRKGEDEIRRGDHVGLGRGIGLQLWCGLRFVRH